VLLDALQAPRGLVSVMANFSSRCLARTPLQRATRVKILTSHIHTHTHTLARTHARTQQLLFLSGVSLILGFERTKNLFFKPDKLRGSALFFLGIPLFLFPLFLLPFLCANAQGCPDTLVVDLKGLHWTLKTSIRSERSALDLIHF